MRLIVPLILIALMLPYATSDDDEPNGDWLIPPDPAIADVVNAAVHPSLDHIPTTHPATQPAIAAAATAR